MTALAEALRDISDTLHGYTCRTLWRTGRLVGYWVERLWGDR